MKVLRPYKFINNFKITKYRLSLLSPHVREIYYTTVGTILPALFPGATYIADYKIQILIIPVTMSKYYLFKNSNSNR